MQIHFTRNYTTRRDAVAKIGEAQESRGRPVSAEITQSQAESSEELNALHRQIVTYILLSSGEGSPTDDDVVQEATAALESVFPAANMDIFMKLLRSEKEQQLRELAAVVMGVRCFNRVCGLVDEDASLKELTVPSSLQNPPKVTSKEIESELNACQTLVWKYTAVLEKMISTDGVKDVSEGGDAPLLLLKRALYNVRQFEGFLKLLLTDAQVSEKRVASLQSALAAQLKQLKEAIQSKEGLPSAEAFPLFKKLSKLWAGLQQEAQMIDTPGKVMVALQPFLTSQAQIFSEADLNEMLGDTVVKTDAQRMRESSVGRIDPEAMQDQEWLLPGITKYFNELPLQYNGFCGYTLARSDGLLLPGNPFIGLLRYKEKFYIFSSKEAAERFSHTPDYFISMAEEKSKHCPELIRLFKLHKQYISTYSELRNSLDAAAKCEVSTQTDTHPTEMSLDRSYEWNEWELRREAIKLADLRTAATHSAQTKMSHVRRENSTQTWLPKDDGCQTKRDGETNVPRPHVFIAGLRGKREGGMERINLTRGVDE
ncbi:cilia- and flagella-associated protein 206-like [Synchiropus splendidus]|uniref:cilia- and flagella-associated protein 206-like n=1 Tax=Synchiropus splendidus TaxID=270530 RepID=UPI00237EA162|nr:cilia- and flagella-associated protein 206-like [Synchiropus splendidus]